MTTAALPKTIIFAGTFEQWQQWQSLLHALRHPETVEGWEDDAVALGAELAEAQRLIDGVGNSQDELQAGSGIGQVAEDLGTRCIVSGGEVLEIGAQTGSTEIPY